MYTSKIFVYLGDENMKKKGNRKRKTKLVYEYKSQTGKSKTKLDKKRKALAPGKRVSKNGKVYYERRKNRSDRPGKRI